jgi:hypothetical protein
MDNGPERNGRYTQFFVTKLVTIVTALEGAKSITWKGMYPIVELSWKVYQRGWRDTRGPCRRSKPTRCVTLSC